MVANIETALETLRPYGGGHEIKYKIVYKEVLERLRPLGNQAEQCPFILCTSSEYGYRFSYVIR